MSEEFVALAVVSLTTVGMGVGITVVYKLLSLGVEFTRRRTGGSD